MIFHTKGVSLFSESQSFLRAAFLLFADYKNTDFSKWHFSEKPGLFILANPRGNNSLHESLHEKHVIGYLK